MWGMLIAIIVLTVIFMMNPFKFGIISNPVETQKKKDEVNKIVDDVTKQVDYARQMQKYE